MNKQTQRNRDKADWYKMRGYRHFDRPISEKKITSYLSHPKKIAEHGFLPFLMHEKKVRRKSKPQDPKTRRLAYSSHVESHIFKYYSHILQNAYENRLKELDLSNNIIAYRKIPCNPGISQKNKSTIHHAVEAFEQIRT